MSHSPRPEYHEPKDNTERLIMSVRKAPLGVSDEDIVEALGVDPAEAFLIMTAARLLGEPPRRTR